MSEVVKDIYTKLRKSFKSFDFDIGALIVVGSIISFLVILKGIAKTAEKIATTAVNRLAAVIIVFVSMYTYLYLIP